MSFMIYETIAAVSAIVYLSVYAISCFRYRVKLSPRTIIYDEVGEE